MDKLVKLLESYSPSESEVQAKNDILHLIKTHSKSCLYRDLFEPGHITGSAFLISYDKQKVLMNYHSKLKKWVGFGGHADGEADIFNVAKREVQEESGIENIIAVSNDILDIDVHDIPENIKEPKHRHFDIRYLFFVADKKYEDFQMSDESQELRWCSYNEACNLINPKDEDLFRLLGKWQQSLNQKERQDA